MRSISIGSAWSASMSITSAVSPDSVRAAGQLGGEAVELVAQRQLAAQRQVGDFLVGGVLGEVVDVVPAVDQDAALAVDGAQPAARHDHTFETALVSHSSPPFLPFDLHRIVANRATIARGH